MKQRFAQQCFTNVSTDYLLHAPPAGDVLFGVALERLTWAPGEAVCFDFVAESYSGIEFTRIQVQHVCIRFHRSHALAHKHSCLRGQVCACLHMLVICR